MRRVLLCVAAAPTPLAAANHGTKRHGLLAGCGAAASDSERATHGGASRRHAGARAAA
eukprot:COSAG04_NODE_5581_length_1561_cov_8.110123_3_plen_57_part_01